jgi:hypothetical protein
MGENKIQDYLDEIKAQGKASPTGMYWNEFFLFLCKYKQAGDTDPPVPLILAASGESPASKHFRLSLQLDWALDHNILDQALNYLKQLENQEWVTSTPSRWNTENYY